MKCYTGKEYLLIDIANHYGLDKEQFEERINWAEYWEEQLELFNDDADDFFQFGAAVQAYRKAQAGEPSGYMVSLDACASGPQILSCLIGCKIGAANVGATGNKRKDVYSIVAKTMNDMISSMVTYDRSVIKNAFMTHFYGSTLQPKEAFGADSSELEAFYVATDTVCPGANKLLHIMLSLWDEDALSYSCDLPDGFVSKWLVKDKVKRKIEIDTIENHPTFEYIYTENTPLENGLFIPANVTHSVDAFINRELTARCNHDKGKLRTLKYELVRRIKSDKNSPMAHTYMEEMWLKHNFMSIEGAEHIDNVSVWGYSIDYCKKLLNLVNIVLERPSFKVVSIHDCFKCLPNYGNQVRQTYIDVMAELADSTVLTAMLSDIAGYPVLIEKMSDNLSDDIRKSEYLLS